VFSVFIHWATGFKVPSRPPIRTFLLDSSFHSLTQSRTAAAQRIRLLSHYPCVSSLALFLQAQIAGTMTSHSRTLLGGSLKLSIHIASLLIAFLLISFFCCIVESSSALSLSQIDSQDAIAPHNYPLADEDLVSRSKCEDPGIRTFDYFVLSVMWQTTNCMGSWNQCKQHKVKPYFTIHGLWPTLTDAVEG